MVAYISPAPPAATVEETAGGVIHTHTVGQGVTYFALGTAAGPEGRFIRKHYYLAIL